MAKKKLEQAISETFKKYMDKALALNESRSWRALRDIDRDIAINIFGFEQPNERMTFEQCCLAKKRLDNCPGYSSEIALAWMIVERLSDDNDFSLVNESDGWRASFCERINNYNGCLADTAAEAICLAALKASVPNR